MKINLDPKLFYGIAVFVVVGAAFLVYRGADSSAKAPLPDAKMFVHAAPSVAPTSAPSPSSN